MAIDDIMLTPGPCAPPGESLKRNNTMSLIISLHPNCSNSYVYVFIIITIYFIISGFCDFENGMCDYTNLKSDHFDWIVGSAGTPSRFTGPLFDHTTGAKNGTVILSIYYNITHGIIYV